MAYFAYPNPVISKGKSLQELSEIQPLGEDHPWIREQVELVKKIKQEFTEDIVAIYNIFCACDLPQMVTWRSVWWR